MKEEAAMKKHHLTQRPWYDNGAREGWETNWGYGELSSLAADREGRALLESYCRLCRKKLY